MFETYTDSLIKFTKYISDSPNLTIGSLGPEGTTTYEATKYLKDYISKIAPEAKSNIMLRNTFDKIYEDLKNGTIDLAIVPNPYEDVTKYYWDEETHLLFFFELQTPLYGLACKDKNILQKSKLTVATGPAVNSLFTKLFTEDNIEYEYYNVNSTTEAAMAVNNGKADLAITNETSIMNSDLFFISDTYNISVLWSIFVLKDNLITKEKI